MGRINSKGESPLAGRGEMGVGRGEMRWFLSMLSIKEDGQHRTPPEWRCAKKKKL